MLRSTHTGAPGAIHGQWFVYLFSFSFLSSEIILRFCTVSSGISVLNNPSYFPFLLSCGRISGHLNAICWLSKWVEQSGHNFGPPGPQKFSLKCAMRERYAYIIFASSCGIFCNFRSFASPIYCAMYFPFLNFSLRLASCFRIPLGTEFFWKHWFFVFFHHIVEIIKSDWRQNYTDGNCPTL